MRGIFVLALLVSLGLACEGEAPKTLKNDPGPEAAPKTPGGEKAGMNGKRLGGGGGLGQDFPEVELEVSRSFANDRGMMTSIDGVKIKGKAWEDKGEILAGIIAARGGWSNSGGRSDADILSTAEAFVRGYAGILEEGLLSDAEAPEDFQEAVKKAGGDFPTYHPPRAAIYKLDNGERIVAVAYFERGYVGMRGRNWSFRVPAFRVKDGKRYDIRYAGDTDAVSGPQPVDKTIPRPTGFSER